MTDLGIHGRVDPELLAGITEYIRGMQGAGAAAEGAGAKAQRSNVSIAGLASAASSFSVGANAVIQFGERIAAAAEHVAGLAAEQQRLDMMSRRLGLDFDEAAGAAGRFTDEVDVMNTAGQFAARGIRLTQEELNAMTRAAARNAEQTGVETSAALGTLEEALVRGRARGLLPFGQGLADAAAHGYTLREGLAALVAQEGSTTAATDDARTAAQGLSDAFGDGSRALATMASNAIGLPEMVSNITHEVADLVTQLNEINRLGAVARRNGAAADTRAPAAAEFATTQRQVSEAAARAGMTTEDRRRLLALPNVNQLNPDQLRELSGRLSVAVHRQNDGVQGSADSIASAFRSGAAANDNAFGVVHSENEIDRMARTVAAPVSAAVQRRALEHALADARRFAEGAIADNARAAAPTDTAARNRRVSANGGGGGSHMFEQTDETRRASMIAFETKQRAETDAANQRRVAQNQANVAAIAAEERAMAATAAEEQARNDQRVAENEKNVQAQRLEAHETFTGRLAELYGEQTRLGGAAADAMKASLDGVGEAMSTNLQLFVDGKATLAEALDGLAADVVRSISKQAYAKGSYFAAESLGMLAVGNFPGAGLAAAASVGFFATGALLGAAANAIAPSAPAKGTGGGNGGAGGQLSDRAPVSSENMAPINITYNAPVFGGREGSDAEVGTRLDRYDDAARARRRRAA